MYDKYLPFFYHVILPADLVGEGAFSQVFRGTYQGTEVAIKRLATPLAAQDRNYFAAEVGSVDAVKPNYKAVCASILTCVCKYSHLYLFMMKIKFGASFGLHGIFVQSMIMPES